MNVLVIHPPIRRTHEILIFDIDEALGPADGLGVRPHNGIIHRTALFGGEGGLVFQLEPVHMCEAGERLFKKLFPAFTHLAESDVMERNTCTLQDASSWSPLRPGTQLTS